MTWFLTVDRLALIAAEGFPEFFTGRQLAAQAIGVHVAHVSRYGSIPVFGGAVQRGVLLAGLVGDLIRQTVSLALGHRVDGYLAGVLQVTRRCHAAFDVDDDGLFPIWSGGLGAHAVLKLPSLDQVGVYGSNWTRWTIAFLPTRGQKGRRPRTVISRPEPPRVKPSPNPCVRFVSATIATEHGRGAVWWREHAF